MRKPFDFNDGDFLFRTSDNTAMDSDGDTMLRCGNDMAMDMDTGEMHLTSRWDDDDED